MYFFDSLLDDNFKILHFNSSISGIICTLKCVTLLLLMKYALCTLTPKPYIKSSFFATEFVVFFFLCPVCPAKWTNIFCAAGAYWFERCKMLPGDAWRTRHLGIHQRFQTRKVQTQRNAAAGLIWLIMHKNTGRSLNSYWHLLRYAELASQHGTYYVVGKYKEQSRDTISEQMSLISMKVQCSSITFAAVQFFWSWSLIWRTVSAPDDTYEIVK